MMLNANCLRSCLLLLALIWLAPAGAAESPRIISLGGDVTEIVFALGAGEQLIARDTTSSYPEAAQDLPDVGYLRQLSLEGILSFRPDLVLISEAARPAPIAQRLRAAGVEVIEVVHQQDLPGVKKKIQQVAAALNRQAASEQLIVQLQQQEEHLAALSPLSDSGAVFILNHGGMSSPLVAGQGSSADSMLALAGIRNAVQGLNGYRPLSAEGLVRAQPEVVLVTQASLRSLGGSEGLWRLPGLKATPAGRNQKLLVVDDLAFLGFGPRTPSELLQLRAELEQL